MIELSKMTRARILAALPFLWLAIAALACSQGTNPVVYVTATPFIAPGSEPTLPNPFKPTPTPSGPTATAIRPTPNPTFPPLNVTSKYTVQAGDTLALIAQLYGVSVDQILVLNPGVTATSILNVGRILTAP